MTVEAKTVNGANLNAFVNKNRWGHGNVIYIYNIAINPYNGQLVVGTGYIPVEGGYKGSGTGITPGGGNGEYMRLTPDVNFTPENTDTVQENTAINNNLSVVDKNISDNIENNGQGAKITAANGNFWPTYGNPIEPGYYAKNLGLAQVFHISVPDGGGGTAQYSPIWISDIDDDQELVVSKGSVESGTQAHLAVSGNMDASKNLTMRVNLIGIKIRQVMVIPAVLNISSFQMVHRTQRQRLVRLLNLDVIMP